ncbi:helix-turn-helix transcriptional regulator [Sphingobium bisphenolivorans]|uniref:helix-turn-helix transcriptional regulator n=1 Tax=Sphingobium bisphenolivorans TaxID=1335760 RepID=UPI0003A1999B|nr:helix-turn-helix transcriptional regulator [Sphingobium bisphenolivorans]
MNLTSTDESELLLPLYAGVHDQPEWANFLLRVRRRTGADYASLIFAQGDTPIHLSKEVFSGRNIREEALQLGLEFLYEKDRVPYDRLRAGRVYYMEEFASLDPDFHEFQEKFNDKLGLKDGRVIRIKEQEGTSAWLMLASSMESFSASTGALLTALAPHVTVALRSFVLMERHRIRAAASSEGLDRADVGWIALGRDARIIDIDPKLGPLLKEVNGSSRLLGERLPVASPVRETLLQTAAAFAADANGLPRALRLLEDPLLDALLVPIAARADAALAVPVMLIFCRIRRTSDPASKIVVADIFGLSLREAELALAMSSGLSLAEAAASMGVNIETARGYSKRIYAKMAVRGQAEMVRKIFMSSASLA